MSWDPSNSRLVVTHPNGEAPEDGVYFGGLGTPGMELLLAFVWKVDAEAACVPANLDRCMGKWKCKKEL